MSQAPATAEVILAPGGDAALLARLQREVGGHGLLIEQPFRGVLATLHSGEAGFTGSPDDERALGRIAASTGATLLMLIIARRPEGLQIEGALANEDGLALIEPTSATDAFAEACEDAGLTLEDPEPLFALAAGASFDDVFWMRRALALASRGLGHTAPNPSVGCVVVSDNWAVGDGRTGDGGRPHAEERALSTAGPAAGGATIYVTLEPCTARSSGVAACAQRLIQAQPSRVVVACSDPNPAAAHGVSRLGAAGIEVTFGVMETEAAALNAGFFKRIATGRPLLAVDSNAFAYDAPFDLKQGETFEAALDRLGSDGMTRVHVLPGTALAAQLLARGLVDVGD